MKFHFAIETGYVPHADLNGIAIYWGWPQRDNVRGYRGGIQMGGPLFARSWVIEYPSEALKRWLARRRRA